MFTGSGCFLADRRKKSIAPRIVGNLLKNLIPNEDNPHKSRPPRARGSAEDASQIAGAKRFQTSGHGALPHVSGGLRRMWNSLGSFSAAGDGAPMNGPSARRPLRLVAQPCDA